MPTRDAYVVAVLALLVFFVAFNLQAGWVYAVDALLAGVLVAGWLSAHHAVRGISVVRTFPPEVAEGAALTVGLTLRAAGIGWRFLVEVQDSVPGLEPAAVVVPVVDPRLKVGVTYGTVAVRRGLHRVRTVTLRSTGLTGLFAARRTVPAPGEIVVYPRHWRVSRLPLAAWTPAAQTVGTARRRGGLEFAGLRDYRAGDSVRHVHWRSSARRGALVVREFEQELPGSVVLLVDTRPDPYAGSGASDAFEDLIRAAASITWYVTSRGGAIRILAATHAGTLDVRDGWAQAMAALAALQPQGRLAPRAVLAAAAPGRGPVVIVLSGDPHALSSFGGDGVRVAGILADVASYTGGETRASGGAAISPVRAACVLRRGDDIGLRLEQAFP